MGQYDHLLASKDQTIRVQSVGLFVIALCAGVMAWGWLTAPSQLRIHLPPDLSQGAVLQPEVVGHSNIYAFAFYIWQQLYRWPDDGEADYLERIHTLKHYFTPACFQDRLEDFEQRRQARALLGRERAVWERAGQGFASHRVREEGNDTWRVTLDLRIKETMLGEPIKSRAVRYPLRIVRSAIDPEQNPFGLAIDCLAAKPVAIASAAESS